VERELVDQRRWLTPADLTEALTYTKLLPGSTVVQVVAYLGYTLGGWPGSALATVAFVLPSALTMLALATLYGAATAVPALGPAVTGLTATVVGVLLATTYRLGTANIQGPVAAGIAVTACVVGAWLGVNAALIVVAAGVLGIVLWARGPTPTQRAKEGGT
jgi:chromate transporter